MPVYLVYPARVTAAALRSLEDLEIRGSGQEGIYIGKAGGRGLATNLRRRLQQYERYSRGGTNHSGGRAVFQLKDWRQLHICWKPTGRLSPAKEESRLIHGFKDVYGMIPYANGKL